MSSYKLIPAVVLALSLAPLAANARSYRAPLPPQGPAVQSYAVSAFSERHGRAAEQVFTQPQGADAAQQVASHANVSDNSAGG